MDVNHKTAQTKTEESLEKLFSYYSKLDSVLVAFSGGVDSALLAWAAHQALGDKMLAVLADSPSLAHSEKAAAEKFILEHNIPFQIVQTNEMEKENYLINAGDRCYYCKQSLFEKMENLQEQLHHANGMRWKIVYGVNQDDLGDYRPGMNAAREHHVLTPYLDFKINKETIRSICREQKLTVAEKKAMPCLSSRIPHGEPVTLEKLSQIERAEYFLKQLGCIEFRVRHHGTLARIEVSENEFDFIIKSKKEIHLEFKSFGFLFVTIDLSPFKSGSLNSTLQNINI
jgi:pyridinium-3,5-biscarboxylic acid mononucleotide sulfurtransferase